MKRTNFQKVIVASLMGEHQVASAAAPKKHWMRFDKIICHYDGSISIRRYFFYRNGMTTDQIRDFLVARFPFAKLVIAHEHVRPWPSDNYWEVVLQPVNPDYLEDTDQLINQIVH